MVLTNETTRRSANRPSQWRRHTNWASDWFLTNLISRFGTRATCQTCQTSKPDSVDRNFRQTRVSSTSAMTVVQSLTSPTFPTEWKKKKKLPNACLQPSIETMPRNQIEKPAYLVFFCFFLPNVPNAPRVCRQKVLNSSDTYSKKKPSSLLQGNETYAYYSEIRYNMVRQSWWDIYNGWSVRASALDWFYWLGASVTKQLWAALVERALPLSR